jgi:peroxiredoxin
MESKEFSLAHRTVAPKLSHILPWVLASVLGISTAMTSSRLATLAKERDTAKTALRYPYRGMPLPDVSLKSTSGTELSVVPESRGRASVLYFVADRCRYCTASVNDWTLLARTIDTMDSSVRFIVIAADTARSSVAWASHHFGAHRTVEDLSMRSRSLLRASVAPATVVVGADGIVHFAHLGAFVGDSMRKEVMQVIASAQRF